ncbi:MAG: Fur family transcriptional regulator [Synergistota bacterium]|nr:Fur family transcriptional regulator [Synergistota bacterium]
MPRLQLPDVRVRVEMMDPSAILRSNEIRPTPLRKKTLALLLEAGEPLSLKTLFERFSVKQPDRVSLYRTLDLLERKGIVHKVLGADGAWRYCAHSPEEEGCPGNHAHFLCLECGRMICLPEQPIPMVELPGGYVVQGKQLLAYGLCAKCARGG